MHPTLAEAVANTATAIRTLDRHFFITFPPLSYLFKHITV